MVAFLEHLFIFFTDIASFNLVPGITIGGFWAYTFAIPLIYFAFLRRRA